jgi:hypothetical protein
VFGNGREQMREQADAEKDELYKQIGQLKVELEYQAALDSEFKISLRWLTADEVKRGLQPGLYEVPPEDGDSPVVPALVDT